MDLATAWSDERHVNGKPRLFRHLGRCYSRSAWALHEENWSDVLLRVTRPRHELYLLSRIRSPVQQPATLGRFWIHIAKLVVIKRGEALNPGIIVVCLCVFKNPDATDLL